MKPYKSNDNLDVRLFRKGKWDVIELNDNCVTTTARGPFNLKNPSFIWSINYQKTGVTTNKNRRKKNQFTISKKGSIKGFLEANLDVDFHISETNIFFKAQVVQTKNRWLIDIIICIK